MSSNSKVCDCPSCPGAECQCGCRNQTTTGQSTPCPCGDNCQCGPDCNCASK